MCLNGPGGIPLQWPLHHLTLSVCLACCSLNITYSFSSWRPEGKGSGGWPQPGPAIPGCGITKAGSVFAALTLSPPCYPEALVSDRTQPAFSAPLSSGPSPRSVTRAGFVLFFRGVSGPENSMGLVTLWATPLLCCHLRFSSWQLFITSAVALGAASAKAGSSSHPSPAFLGRVSQAKGLNHSPLPKLWPRSEP